MLRQVRAQAPLLYRLANRSKQAASYADNSSTEFQKKAFVIELDGVNTQLVSESIKLGQSVMSALGKNRDIDTLEDFSKKVREEKPAEGAEDYSGGRESLAMSMRNALLTGAGIAAVPALAANYTLNKASDDFDSKMLAIPGVAAATVGAILAARAGSGSNSIREVEAPAKELENALNAKEVLDNAIEQADNPDTYVELSKMSSISTDHIASLITDLLL